MPRRTRPRRFAPDPILAAPERLEGAGDHEVAAVRLAEQATSVLGAMFCGARQVRVDGRLTGDLVDILARADVEPDFPRLLQEQVAACLAGDDDIDLSDLQLDPGRLAQMREHVAVQVTSALLAFGPVLRQGRAFDGPLRGQPHG